MELSPVACRVLGSLVEKSLTTPNQYPLSLAALVTACNQRSARDPVMALTETDVQRGLHELRDHDLARTSPVRGRVAKHEHTVRRQLDLAEPAQTVLGVLLLRGPQTVGEIRTRTDRWHAFADLDEVEAVLVALAQHPFLPLAEELPREPGRRESRWTHLLGDGTAQLSPAPDRAAAGALAGGAGETAAGAMEPTRSPTSRLATLEERVAALEQRLTELTDALAPLLEDDGVSWVLLSNDDGVDSPALLPFADELERRLGMPVRVSAPDGERSWSGKAVTRGTTVRAVTTRREGRLVAAVSGTPADAVQLGLYSLFAAEFAGAPPAVVVTGVNLGFNAGSGFLASSGTVWAAAEAAYAGLPAVAVSTGATGGDFRIWRRAATAGDAASAAAWRRVAAVAADTVARVGDSDLLAHCDLVSINLPWGSDTATQRSVTRLSTLAYGPLFEPDDSDGVHRSRDLLDLTIDHDRATDPGGGDDHPGDVETLRAGGVSITPVVLPRSSTVPTRTRSRLERRADDD